jgi:hypothetical protein
MKPWQAALAAAAGWFVLTLVVCFVHTEVLVRDLTPQQDFAISYAYGRGAGLGALLCGVLAYQIQRRRRTSVSGVRPR